MILTAIESKLAPYKLAVEAILLLALIAGIFAAGWTVKGWKDDKATAAILLSQATQEAQGLALAVKAATAQANADNAAALASAKAEDHTRVVYRTITQEVQNAKVTDCQLGDDFIRVWGLATDQARGAPAARAAGAGHAALP